MTYCEKKGAKNNFKFASVSDWFKVKCLLIRLFKGLGHQFEYLGPVHTTKLYFSG